MTTPKYQPLGGYKLPIKSLTKNHHHELFAQSFQLNKTFQDYGPISNIAVSNCNNKFAITSGYNVTFVNGATLKAERKISDFKNNALGGAYKQNGELFACGSGEGIVKMYTTGSISTLGKNALRKFSPKGNKFSEKFSNLFTNKSKARIVKFLNNSNSIMVFYDNGACLVYDIASSKCIQIFQAHRERIQAISISHSDILATGSYDKTVKLWDPSLSNIKESTLDLDSVDYTAKTRDNKPLFSLDHSSPVEDLQWLGKSNLLASCGSGKIKFWDIRNTSQNIPSTSLSIWSKPVMCMEYNQKHNLVLAGSLDCTVRSINPNDLSVEKFTNASAPVLCMKFMKNETNSLCKTNNLILGLQSGLVEVYKDNAKQEEFIDAIENFEQEMEFNVNLKKKKRIALVSANDKKTRQMKSFDHSNKTLSKHFRKFKFRTAFLYALNRWFIYDNEFMEPLLNCLFELERLNALNQALGNQNDQDVSKLLQYIGKFMLNYKAHDNIISSNISKNSIIPLFVGIVNLLIDLGYCSDNFKLCKIQFEKLGKNLELGNVLEERLNAVDGILEMFLNNMN